MEATRPRRTITEEEEKGVSRRRQGSQFPPDVLSALMLMFADLDVDCDGVLSREEVSANAACGSVVVHLFPSPCFVLFFVVFRS